MTPSSGMTSSSTECLLALGKSRADPPRPVRTRFKMIRSEPLRTEPGRITDGTKGSTAGVTSGCMHRARPRRYTVVTQLRAPATSARWYACTSGCTRRLGGRRFKCVCAALVLLPAAEPPFEEPEQRRVELLVDVRKRLLVVVRAVVVAERLLQYLQLPVSRAEQVEVARTVLSHPRRLRKHVTASAKLAPSSSSGGRTCGGSIVGMASSSRLPLPCGPLW
eukprot:764836-Hanusia_phi.AAC.1